MSRDSEMPSSRDESVKNLGLIVFQPNEAESIVRGLGLTVGPNGQLRDHDKPALCSCCNEKIKLARFGAALPGSRLYYCDAPACLLNYVNRKRGKAT